MCTLPPELDDIILDHLHDDRAALASCALVRRSWLPTVRYHNWRDLRVACAEKDLKELEDDHQIRLGQMSGMVNRF